MRDVARPSDRANPRLTSQRCLEVTGDKSRHVPRTDIVEVQEDIAEREEETSPAESELGKSKSDHLLEI